MDLLFNLGVEGFESLADSGTVSFNLSALNPDAALLQVHDVPSNETVLSMHVLGALILNISEAQISIQRADQTYVNPLTPLSSLLINGEIELHVVARDRVGGDDCDTSSTVPQEMEPRPDVFWDAPAPLYPRDNSRRAVGEQPNPTERPSKRPDQRWYCKALVEHEGTGKAKAGTWYSGPRQEFTGPTRDDVVRQREAWINEYLHPKPRAAKSGAKFAPTVEAQGRPKRLATPKSMEEVRRLGPTSEKARAGPGRGHHRRAKCPFQAGGAD